MADLAPRAATDLGYVASLDLTKSKTHSGRREGSMDSTSVMKKVLDLPIQSAATVENGNILSDPSSKGDLDNGVHHYEEDHEGTDKDGIKIVVGGNPSRSGLPSSSLSSSITNSRVITRNVSAAESVVDVWTPHALRRLSSKYDTDTESTLKQSRPVSKRGAIPAFSDLKEGEEGAGTPVRRVPSTTFNTVPYGEAVADAMTALSPIDSVHNIVDLSQPISLDELRAPGSPSDLTPGSRGHQKISSTKCSSIVHMDTRDNLELEGVEDVSDSSSVASSRSLDSRPPTPKSTGARDVKSAEEGEGDEPEKSDSVSTVTIQGPPTETSPMALFPSPMDSKGGCDVLATQGQFYFSGDGSKSVLGSPSLSNAPDNSVPTFVVGGENSNPIFAADANNSSLWAAAAAAAHRRNTSAMSLSSELQAINQASRTNPEVENPSVLRQALRLVGLVKSASRVMPGPGSETSTTRRPPSPDASAVPRPSDSSIGISITTPVKPGAPGPISVTPLKPDQAPFFNGVGGELGKTPLASPHGSDTGSSTSPSTVASSPRAGATARVEAEGDMEEGHAAVIARGGRVQAEAGGSTSAWVAGPAYSKAMSADIEMVLPNAPTNGEKVMYLRTERFGLISFALLSFWALSTGMWLFTIVSPAFYWFGLPAVFFMVYLMCHYFGIALWGKDFDMEEHAQFRRRAREDGYQPEIDVFLPVCKEPTYLLANTWKYVAALDYPRVTVHVLDDGADDDVRELAEEFGFKYVVRTDRPLLKKAGNLRYAFARTSGEGIAIFDADFCPRPDFLKDTVPYLYNTNVGIVQTPQYFRYKKEQTWVEQGAGVTQEFFYRMVQMNQDRFNAAVCVGSCGLYRRAALEPFGGMAPIAHSEDMYTGFKMTENGFSIKYVPLNLAMGACPDDPQTFFMQQYRWCMGSATLISEKGFWGSNISKLHKLCFLNGLLYYLATSILVFLAPVPILLLVWVKADAVLWYHSIFVLPSIIFAGIIMPLWAKQRYGMACHRVKIIQCYAHIFAIKDRIMGRSAPWVPSGAGSSKAASMTYRSSVFLMLTWNIVITILIVGGSAWRMTENTWYHFVPAVILAVVSFFLNLSTVIH